MITDFDPPAAEPISLHSAKAFLRIDHDDEDNLISTLITSARIHIESYLSASLILRRRRYEKSAPPQSCLYLNHHPVKQIISVTTVSREGPRLSDSSDYLVNLHARPVSLRWLKRHSRRLDAVIIDFEAGYGSSEDDVPMPIRQALMLMLAQSYERRGDQDEGRHAIPMMAQALLMPYRGLRL